MLLKSFIYEAWQKHQIRESGVLLYSTCRFVDATKFTAHTPFFFFVFFSFGTLPASPFANKIQRNCSFETKISPFVRPR